MNRGVEKAQFHFALPLHPEIFSGSVPSQASFLACYTNQELS